MCSRTSETKTILYVKHFFYFITSKNCCLKHNCCLEVSSIASLQFCRINQNWNLKIPTVRKRSIMEFRYMLASFSARREIQFKKKEKRKPKSEEVLQQTNKQNKRPFLPKINKIFLSPILQNLKIIIGTIIFENDPLVEPKKILSK